MAYSFTEKKRIRKDFSKLKETLEIPYLLSTQIDSYRHFLQAEIQPSSAAMLALQASFKLRVPDGASYEQRRGAGVRQVPSRRADLRRKGMPRPRHDLRRAAEGDGAPGDLRPRVQGKARQGRP